MSARRRPTRAALTVLALAAALSLALTGCVPGLLLPPAGSATSTPTDETVAAELRPYYGQVLQWSDCGGGMQCATAEAPLNWAEPGGESIGLALVRQPATSADRLGSLLVNPGGPGASGVDFVMNSVDYATDERLQARYDIVGFDPRGVGGSGAVSCYEDPAEFDAFIYDIPDGDVGSDQWIQSLADSSRAFGERCLELTGPLLAHVDTASAARDLDLLRAVLGDTKLNYLGYSYGTLLGAVYAELFPGKTGRLVLDGAVDPAASDFEGTATQAQGFESALAAFLLDCAEASDCPFRGDPDDSLKQIRSLLDTLDASPLASSDGRQLGSGAMFIAIILPLYNQSTWPQLRELFTDVLRGGTEVAFRLADAYYSRNSDGSYQNNQTEAFISVICLDARGDSSLEAIRADAAELKRLAPVFGPQMSYGATSCATWPVPVARERQPVIAAGSADILVIGTTNDPATPYSWAVTVADTLENGHLVTYEGEGHTAYNKSNSCINDTIDDFLVDGTVPAADPKC